MQVFKIYSLLSVLSMFALESVFAGDLTDKDATANNEEPSAMSEWRASEAEILSGMTSVKTEAEMIEEAQASHRLALQRRIAVLEKGIAEKAQPMAMAAAPAAHESALADSKKAICDELDFLSLKLAKVELEALDFPIEKQRELHSEWKRSADGIRMAQLHVKLHEAEEIELIGRLKSEIAGLKAAEASLSGEALEINSRRLAALEMQLADLEFMKFFDAQPESRKAALMDEYLSRKRQALMKINE